MAVVIGGRREVFALDAGALDRRVGLLKPDFNEYGDEIVGYTQVAQAWAAVSPKAGTEIDDAARVVSAVEVQIHMRYRTDVDARWRVRDGDKEYEVRAVEDVARRHVTTALACREVL